MSDEMTKGQLESQLHRLRGKFGTIEEEGRRARHLGEFIGGAMAGSAYRAYLAKNKKPMPKIMGFDADYVAGGALVVAGFLDLIPDAYAEDAMYLGAGLVAGAAGNIAAGWINPSVAVHGAGAARGALGPGGQDVSAHRGQQILDMVRAHAALATRGGGPYAATPDGRRVRVVSRRKPRSKRGEATLATNLDNGENTNEQRHFRTGRASFGW